jgi:hypothetical protein
MKNDIDKLFLELLTNYEKSGEIVNDSYIKYLIESWNIKDFRFDVKENVTNEYAIKKLMKIIEKLFSSMPINITYNMMAKSKIEIDNIFKDETCTNSFYLCMFCFSIYRFFAKKIKNPSDEELVFSNLTVTSLENVKGLLLSYMSNDWLTVIQKVRIVYESYIIFLFINKHKELVKPFIEHIKNIEYKIFKDLPDFHDEKPDEYSEDNFAWTKIILSDRSNRNLAFLAKDVGMGETFSILYKLSSNFIHINAYSAFFNKSLNKNYVNIYLPLITDFLIRQINYYVNIVSKTEYHKKFIGILLNKLENILFPESIINSS